MRIAIIDADLIGRKHHRFPNLASMKLAGFFKAKGNEVTLVTAYDRLFAGEGAGVAGAAGCLLYDRIFLSKVFTDTPVPEEILKLPECSYGGTGFFYAHAPPLPEEIEHHMPDYHLYDDWVTEQMQSGVKWQALTYFLDWSIGFTTRGCIRGCSFCVNQHYRHASRHSPVEEFLDESRPYICLLMITCLLVKTGDKCFTFFKQQGNRSNSSRAATKGF